MSGDTMERKEVAYELLIELLVHQFAFPVKWVDTQDSILGRDAVERFVELGPSSVLTGMGQKTLKSGVVAGNHPLGSKPVFLTSTNHSKEIFYDYDAPPEDVQEIVSQDKTPIAVVEAVQEALTPASPEGNGANDIVTSTAAAMADVAISGEQIARALVARKLKIPISQVLGTKSIKELTNGKSTLQNELVGDFQSEFGKLPDRPEDIPLKDLGESVTSGGDITLGKMSSALLAKLISSKMPASFNSDAIGQYLASQWGLGPMRQMAVMLFAIAAEPDARLSSVAAAEQYLDEVCMMYGKWCGIELQARSHLPAPAETVTVAVDPAAIAAGSQKQTTLARKQFKALAEFLQVDLAQSSKDQDLVDELQRKVDAWVSEFSDDFLAGLSPVFDPKRKRRFNAWWNCARQDVMALFSADSDTQERLAGEPKLNSLRNRSDDNLCQIIRGLISSKEPEKISDALQRAEEAISSGLAQLPTARIDLPALAPRTTVTKEGRIQYDEVPRFELNARKTYMDILRENVIYGKTVKAPFVRFESAQDQEVRSQILTQMRTALEDGLCFAGRSFLVTGASPRSIGYEVIRLLLMGGARVIVTTSREPHSVAKQFQSLYEECGAKDSELVFLQFNQASARDSEALIDYIYSAEGLGLDLDAILPFAAASEAGVELQDIAAKNELVHRLMLANVFRLLGRIIKNKRDRRIDCHPTQVLLPLSPNHGIFGGDGMYAESKLGLESLINRVKSESWSDELSICGVKIGWTRGTGLMNVNDIVAESIEQHGVLTFSVQEMAFNIAVLMTPEIVEICETAPLMADFGGGLDGLEDCATVLSESRRRINEGADIARAITAENELQRKATIPRENGPTTGKPPAKKSILEVGLPKTPDWKDLLPLQHLQGMNDPADTIVVVGFSELGSWGSARLRWQIECNGALDQKGYLETAWMMGLIKHFDGPYKNGYFVGWVDSKSGEPVRDADIELRYGELIRQHTGIRFIDPESHGGYDTTKKEYLYEMAIEEDLPHFEAPSAIAEAFKLRHGDQVSIEEIAGTENCRIQVKRGASIKIPKSVPFTWGSVAGQLPKGWSHSHYGIPDELANQLDPVSLYALVCVAEAFYSAGISDPQEIFKYIHLAEVGNFLGSSMGGAVKTRQLYRDIYLDKDVPSDVLQETYLNTTGAWINMLLLGSTGPIKTPMGACATAVESIDSACESIMSGKTKMVIAGGFDDFHEDESFGFSKMKATADATAELAKGRLPSEMSRPTAESRSGFVESHGCGVQILCRGDIALEMGLPVYAIIAGSSMAADKIGRSVPAPGQGILTFARESSRGKMPRSALQTPGAPTPSSTSTLGSSAVAVSRACSPRSLSPHPAVASTLSKRSHYNTKLHRQDAMTSPLRAALETWGLTIDDLDVASLHGTSTKANDINEPQVICKQMEQLGRSSARPLLAICQKSVTGHPKAPAAAWMLNGCLQVMETGLVPGNRNADNVEPALREARHLCFPTKNIKVQHVRAFLVTSFGFGQKGGQVVGVAPRYFFAALGEEVYDNYRGRVRKRTQTADRDYAQALMSNQIVKLQDRSPYDDEDQSKVFLDPLARASEHGWDQSYRFDAKALWNEADVRSRSAAWAKVERGRLETYASGIAQATKSVQEWLAEQTRKHNPSTIGLDVVDLDSFTSYTNSVFVERNFTAGEQEFAQRSMDLRSAFASRWAAKEAVFKCLQTPGQGAGAAMKDIEIVTSDGPPLVKLRGDALSAACNFGLHDIQLSISHGDNCLVAVAIGIPGDGVPTYRP